MSSPTPRDWMTLTIEPRPQAAGGPAPNFAGLMRPPELEDADALARLMLDSYRGTVDDAGETLDDASRDVAKLFAGDFGAMDWQASLVLEDARGLIAATIVTRDRVAPPPLSPGEAFLAFSMTAPECKRRGLARAGLECVIAELRRRGEPRLHLVVTRTNTPAVMLYRSLGFVQGPVGDTPIG